MSWIIGITLFIVILNFLFNIWILSIIHNLIVYALNKLDPDNEQIKEIFKD